MKELKSIRDFYDQVEEHDQSWGFDSDCSSALSKLINSKFDSENSKKLDWEKAVFNYSITKGELIPVFGATGVNGEMMSYPNMELFEEGGFEYLEVRSDEVKNLYLIVKYNHLLWLSPKKNLVFAKKAIDAYFEIFFLIKDDKEVEPFYKVSILKNLCVLSFQANQKVLEVKSIFHKILLEDAFWIHDWKVTILQFMLEQKKFSKNDFEGTIKLIETINETQEKESNYWTIHENLLVSLRIAEKYQWPTKKILQELGTACENIAKNKSDDDSKMIAILYLSEALHYYEKSRNKDAAEKVSIEITELKKHHELANISIPLEGEALNNLVGIYKTYVFHYLTFEPVNIFAALTQHDKIIFPNLKDIERSSKTQEFRLYNLFNTINFDINSNITKKNRESSENKNDDLINSYGLKMKFSASFFLLPLMDEGIRRGKLNYENLRQYLLNHSWLGQYKFENRSGDRIGFTWLEIISPALYDLFQQIELMQLTGKSNFTLVIDSLTLKFEGIFRNFAQLIGVQTLTSYKRSEPGAVREMYLEDLLQNKKVQEYFDEDDRAFFNYLFLNGGLNLRNNVAHCFLRPTDYNIATVLLLLLAIMRLSKYKIKENNKE